MSNPYVSPEATGAGPDSATLPISLLQLGLWLYPILLAGAFYGTWLVAWIDLGHMPRPSLDDPKHIGSVVDLSYMLVIGLLVGFPFASFVGVMFQLTVANRPIKAGHIRAEIRLNSFGLLDLKVVQVTRHPSQGNRTQKPANTMRRLILKNGWQKDLFEQGALTACPFVHL